MVLYPFCQYIFPFVSRIYYLVIIKQEIAKVIHFSPLQKSLNKMKIDPPPSSTRKSNIYCDGLNENETHILTYSNA